MRSLMAAPARFLMTCCVTALAATLGNPTRVVHAATAPASDGVTTGVSATTREVRPGQSIAAIVAAAEPGDVVLVHDGNYPQQTITSTKAGVVTVRGTSRTGVHVAGFVLSGATNISFEDLSIDGPIAGTAGKGAMWIKDISSGITLSRLTIDPVSGSGAESTAGVVISSGSHHVTIDDSSIRGRRADGGNGRNVLIFGSLDPQADGDWVHDIMISRNDMSGASADNVQITGAYNVTITHNTMGGVQNNSDHNDGIQSVSSDNLSIIANRITDDDGSYDQGIVLQSGLVAGGCLAQTRTTNSVVANNLISHIGGTGIDLAGAINSMIVANTVFDNGDGLESGAAKQGYALVLYGGSRDTIGCGVNLPQNENTRVWNNVFDSIYRHPTDNGTSYQTSNVIAEAANARPGDVVADPQFVDHVAYKLQATSPAVNFGVTVTGTPVEDLEGTPRGSSPDSGALEFLAPATTADSVPVAALEPATTDMAATTATATATTVESKPRSSSSLPTGAVAALVTAGCVALLVALRRRRHRA